MKNITTIFILIGAVGLFLIGISAIWYMAIIIPRQEAKQEDRILHDRYRKACIENNKETSKALEGLAQYAKGDELPQLAHRVGLADEKGILYDTDKLVNDCVAMKINRGY